MEMSEIRRTVIDKINETLVKLDCSRFPFTVVYKRLGGRYGMYSPKTNTLTFDPAYIHQNFERYLEIVVPHEACHLIQTLKYNDIDKAHGYVWQGLMRKIGLQPKRTIGGFETLSLRKSKTVPYTCGCRSWPFTQVRVNRDLKFQQKLAEKNRPVRPRYSCPLCKRSIKPVEGKA